MAKKKEKSSDILYNMDVVLDAQYADLMDEITIYQAEIERADKKAKRKMNRKFNGKNFYPYEYQMIAREHVIQEMTDKDFFTRVSTCLQQLGPIVILIARLVAALIIAILSVTQIKGKISKDTLSKMESVYNIAMSVGNGGASS